MNLAASRPVSIQSFGTSFFESFVVSNLAWSGLKTQFKKGQSGLVAEVPVADLVLMVVADGKERIVRANSLGTQRP